MNLPIDERASASADLPTSEVVANYLRANPNFFSRHPDVLRDLELTHVTGGAVSLLERQVAGLRDDNQQLKTRFEELVHLAKKNENLIGRIHQLALSLMEAAGPDAIFSTLTERLAQEFEAERVTTMIFADSSHVDEVPQFVGRGHSGRDTFADILDGKIPRCGALNDAQQRLISDQTSPSSGSAAVLPLLGKHWDGLVVISSDDETRFKDTMGTDFLAYLGDIVSLIVDPWVRRERDD